MNRNFNRREPAAGYQEPHLSKGRFSRREAVIAAYYALMNGNSNQSRLHCLHKLA
jgi:hypothetical protein